MTRGLSDYLRADLEVLLVGINPGLRSAKLRHHFAGVGNRFWDLLSDSGLTPRRLTYEEDSRLPDFGIGLTNLAARPTRSSSDLTERDFARGRRVLARKIRQSRPRVVAFVGVTAYRAFGRRRLPLRPGLQTERLEEAAVFVLPNPSGRNAHFRYREMLRYYRALARHLGRGHA
ncbi:MAG: mismatch-specific DNA-glycosylase [Acidobacteria bacterium]|nr:mismatch-specific DNA-glycosylase [Acidobacteriota bacterium]